jgi:CRP-like cAMP-binding protein
MDYIDTLPPIGILAEMNDAERAALASFGTFLKNKKGDKLVQQGTANAFLHLVLSGELRVTAASEEALVTLGYVHPGECVGEMSLLEPVKTGSANVISASDSHVWCIQRADFDRFVEDFPAAGAKMLRGIAVLLAARLRKSDQHMVEAAS